MGLFVSLIVWLALIGVIWWLIDQFIPMAEPIKTIIRVVFVVLLILVFLSLFGVVQFPLPRLHLA